MFKTEFVTLVSFKSPVGLSLVSAGNVRVAVGLEEKRAAITHTHRARHLTNGRGVTPLARCHYPPLHAQQVKGWDGRCIAQGVKKEGGEGKIDIKSAVHSSLQPRSQ